MCYVLFDKHFPPHPVSEHSPNPVNHVNHRHLAGRDVTQGSNVSTDVTRRSSVSTQRVTSVWTEVSHHPVSDIDTHGLTSRQQNKQHGVSFVLWIFDIWQVNCGVSDGFEVY